MIIVKKVNIYVDDFTYMMKEEKFFEDRNELEKYRLKIENLFMRMFSRDVKGHVYFTYEETAN